ncbi:MAG: metallophosphoesterase, partial [Candidatus Diapherotrites archaeon]|nr:metallophosphoesterase [Candidatus Diapherotrites archaeon]
METTLELGNVKKIVEYASEKKAMISMPAAKMLAERQDFKKIIDKLLSEKKFQIDEKAVEEFIVKEDTKIDLETRSEINIEGFEPASKKFEARIRILSEDTEEFIGPTVKDMTAMYQDRFNYLSGVLKKRFGVGNNAKDFSKLHKVTKGHEVDIVGMVEKKWVSKNGHVCISLEDIEGTAIALILKSELNLMRESEKIIPDDIIGLKGVKGEGEMIIAKQIFYPEMPMRQQKKIERDLSLIVLSDIHVGSKLFLEKEFNRFLDWLNCRIGDEKELEKVGKIKYIVIAGDSVDGIGVYPEQINELLITDIYKQYEKLEDLLLQIPEHIHIIFAPGNHDAVRKADPQPAIGKAFLPRLYAKKNFHFVGSPVWVEIEGLKVLVYHGNSMHDLYAQIPGLDASKPEKAITEALKRCCLGFTYGFKNPYVATKKDFMVIRDFPDLYIGGDMHHTGYGN